MGVAVLRPPGGALTGQRPLGYATVLGDLVASRQAGPELFGKLTVALRETNARTDPLQPLQVTIGDEFQGIYRGLGEALNVTLLLRLFLHPVTDVRFGVGWGALTRWNPERAPFQQDGPAWWSAREALEEAAAKERRSRTPEGCRTAVRISGLQPADRPRTTTEDTLLPTEQYLVDARPLDLDIGEVLDALLTFRDHVVHRLDDRDALLVLAMLDGATTTDAAQAAGISQQAASRRLRTNGGYALLESWRLLEGQR